jgi:hypothetical protein
MKLVHCSACGDVFSLSPHRVKKCECGDSAGRYYPDGYRAWVSGQHAVPIGFSNASFLAALATRPDGPPGRVFIAFVIERACATVVSHLFPQE